MFKWKVEYVVKNGEHIVGIYYGPEKDSAGVCKALLAGDANTFNGCKTLGGQGTLCVRNSEIVSLIVSLP